MKITEYNIPETEYYKQETNKHQIILHHTVSKTFLSTFNWWKQDGIHVATSFIVDKDGTIYQLFDPKYWSYHIGSGSNTLNNKGAIGIEIINEGQLYKREDNNYYWWVDNNYPQGKVKYEGEVFDNSVKWRDFRYWAAYTKEQKSSVAELLHYLCNTFKINKKIVNSYEYDKNLLNENCIISHHNVRKDKTDVSVAFDLNKLQEVLDGKDKFINKLRNTTWTS